MRVNELPRLSVADLALGGKALAKPAGRVVFIDRGLPGDVVDARITRVKKTWAEARLEQVVEPSPDRIAARCPHVDQCGGCRMQELPYPRQLELKERQVREVLAHLGGIAPPVDPIVGSAAEWGYRNKMEFSFMPGPGNVAQLGLHVRGAFDRVFELETCLIGTPLTVEIVHATQRFAREHGWRAYHPSRHEGVVRFLTVRHLESTGECAVHLVAASDAIPGLDAWTRAIVQLDPAVRTVTLLFNDSRANVAFGESERVLHGDGRVRERLLGLTFEAPANAFLQTNSAQAERLYAAALDAAGITGRECVLDLYCGTGTLTLLAATRAASAIGVESVADAVAFARRNAELNGIANARFESGEARAVLREWARGERGHAPKPDVVLVDPPRAGLHPRVVARVAELNAPRVVYVSCNPATLARDLKDFAARGYRTARVQPFDLFPHTPHIECVARLERAS
jgi:23S rRNA (uracil1939-C5)-methyltransferase